MPPARGGRRGMGRGRRGGAGGRARGESAAVDVETIKLCDDDLKPDPQTNPPNEEIASPEVCNVEDCEASPLGALEEDERKPASTKNLRRLRKAIAKSDAATAKEHGADTDDQACFQELAPRRRSKRLRSKPTGKSDLGGKDNEDDVFANSWSTQDEARKFAPKRSKRHRERLTSDYFDGEVGQDKGALGSSLDDTDDYSSVPRRALKRLQNRLCTRNLSYVDDDSDTDDSGHPLL